MNILNLSALDIAKKIANKEITSVDVVQFYIDRIKKFDHLNCISTLYDSNALEIAKKMDEHVEIGNLKSIFHGVPILIKDNFDIQGDVTYAGTTYLNKIAVENAKLVDELIECGFVILGKTKMTELAFGLSGQNPKQGTPKNPWSFKNLAPGGSSSGSAVAVAAGLCPLAIGGDTGGSIRTPAAMNGIFGFKPSSDRFNGNGTVPLSKSLDTIGPMSRFSEDITALYGLLNHCNESDMGNFDFDGEIFYLDNKSLPYPLDAEIEMLWNHCLDSLRSKGYKLTSWIPPKSFDFVDLSNRTSDIIAFESYQYHAEYAEKNDIPMWGLVRKRVSRGKEISKDIYLKAIQERNLYQNIFKESLLSKSVLLFPVAPFFAPEITEIDIEFAHVGEFTRPFNYLDAPSYSFPIGFSSNYLPAGIQLVSYQNNDVKVINAVQDICEKLNIFAELPHEFL